MEQVYTYKLIFSDVAIPKDFEEDSAVFFNSIFSPQAMITIVGCLEYAVQENISIHATLEDRQVLELLIEFYKVQSIEPIQVNEMERVSQVIRTAEINVFDGLLIEINRFWCGISPNNSNEQRAMKSFMPKSIEFKQAIENLRIPLGF